MIEIQIPLGPVANIKVTGATANEVLAQLTAVEHSEIPMTVGRVVKASESGEALGRVLGAEVIEEQPKPELPPWAQILDGAPIVNGQPAWFVASEGAFVSPNPDTSLPQTNNVNDPRLAQGQAMFYMKVR
jgi:hypothetical protein